MKTVIALAVALMSLNSFAGEKYYYTAEFKVVSVKPICPVLADRPSCRAVGAKVVLEAYLGCLDRLVYSDFTVSEGEGSVQIDAFSVVRGDKGSMAALCNRTNVVRKEVFSQTAQDISDVEVHNIPALTAF